MPPEKGATMNTKLINILIDPQCYRENFDYLNNLRLPCPFCGSLSRSHATFTRYYRQKKIKIKRYYCKECDKTWSLLPLFCLPRRKLDARMIYRVLISWCRGENLTSAICEVFKDLPKMRVPLVKRAIKRIIRELGLNIDFKRLVRAEGYSKMLFERPHFAIVLLYLAKDYHTKWYLKQGLSLPKGSCDEDAGHDFREKVGCEPDFSQFLPQVFSRLIELFETKNMQKQGGAYA